MIESAESAARYRLGLRGTEQDHNVIAVALPELGVLLGLTEPRYRAVGAWLQQEGYATDGHDPAARGLSAAPRPGWVNGNYLDQLGLYIGTDYRWKNDYRVTVSRRA